jgi:RHS repeat-associated protein
MERFFVRGAGIAEGTGDVLAEIHGSDANSATAVFYIVNHHGDTLNAYLYGTGLIASYRYDAFGNVIQFSCAAGCTNVLPRYTFSTKEYLPDAKVYLYAYRVYDPIAGRWTQRDPIDYQDSVNLYCFCGNSVLLVWDADGQDWETRVCGIAKAVLGVSAAAAGITFGAVTLPTAVGAGAGAGLAVLGVDVMAAGLTELLTGEPQMTATETCLQSLGASPDEAAFLTYMAAGMGTTYASGINAAASTEGWTLTITHEPATGKKYRGGTSYVTKGVNTVTGVKYESHRVEKDGKVVHGPHERRHE